MFSRIPSGSMIARLIVVTCLMRVRPVRSGSVAWTRSAGYLSSGMDMAAFWIRELLVSCGFDKR
jgi:hypothetical protein